MIITISATLTPEQVEILSSMKGYQKDINTLTDTPTPNPQSKEDFIRQVYEGIIMSDATNVFISYSKKQKEEAERIEQEKIRENVISSITSTITE